MGDFSSGDVSGFVSILLSVVSGVVTPGFITFSSALG
jgi:hypothetical protein